MKTGNLVPSLWISNKRTKRQITRCQCRWASLPEEILVIIAELLTAPHGTDFTRFRAVCRSWCSAAANANFTLVPQMPWVMLPPDNDSTETQVFNPSENKLYSLPLPQARWKTLCGSVKGWVATIEDDRRIHLLNLNPFACQPRTYTLPSLHDAVGVPHDTVKFSRFVKKLCLPTSPTEDPNGMAVAIYGWESQLAFARLNSRAWDTISCSTGVPYSDVVSYKGRFYAVNTIGDVVKLDFRRRQVVKVASSPMERASLCCLVESAGDLLQVVDCPGHRVKKVFRLNFGRGEWEAVTSLGERSLFLSYHSYSMSVHAPQLFGCRSNCIYFIDDYYDLEETVDKMAVYSLDEDRVVDKQDMGQSFNSIMLFPIWVSPFKWWQKI